MRLTCIVAGVRGLTEGNQYETLGTKAGDHGLMYRIEGDDGKRRWCYAEWFELA